MIQEMLTIPPFSPRGIDLPAASTPEKALWTAVLGRGIKDHRIKPSHETEKWILASESEVGSYRWILSLLGLESMALKFIDKNIPMDLSRI